jgi:hypothetical protein
MTKDEMMASLDAVFTDERLTEERVEAALAGADECPAVIDGEFMALATGGGSGRRATIVYDRGGLVGYSCSLTRSMAARLQEMSGTGPLPSLTIAMVTATSNRHATRAMTHLVHGRSDDVLRYGPVAIHPHTITSVMVAEPSIADYQVHQTPTGVELGVIAGPGLDHSHLADALRVSLESAGLANATAAVHDVDELPRDEATGKVRRFIRL